MTTYGIWTESGGGFLVNGLHGRAGAEQALTEILAGTNGWQVVDPTDPDNAGDLSIVAQCDEHEDQPADGCDDCASSEDDD